MALFLIAGTTASGKSELAIRLAQESGGVVVSADAMTVYRGLDVGTAKPSLQARQGVPHYGIDIRDLHEDFDVSEFISVVDKARAAHPHVIVAGGTTFWLQALVNPLADLPGPNPKVRDELEQIDSPYAELEKVDPAAAARLHPNDRVRIIRALEVYRLTGHTQTELHEKGTERQPLDATVVWLDRHDLRERIGDRLQSMWSEGYLEETRRALALHPSGNIKPLKSFAYRHIVSHLQGDFDAAEALRRTERDTWQYARKQRTWARGLNWEALSLDEAFTLGKKAFEIG